MSNKATGQNHIHDLKVRLSFDEVVSALMELSPKARQDFIEDLQAATSRTYVSSIKEAREEYRTGKVLSHKEVFKKHRSHKKRKG
jgi:hypothetical protein